MKRSYFLSLLVLSIVVPSCDLLNKVGVQGGVNNINAGTLVNAGLSIEESTRRSKQECDPLADIHSIKPDEEVEMGNALAVGLGMHMNGLRVNLPAAIQNIKAEDIPTKLQGNASYPIPESAFNQLHRSIKKRGDFISKFSSRRSENLPWGFYVINDENTINAISTPGGNILYTVGLLKQIKNEAEFACVTAHEITHVEQKHGLIEPAKLRQQQCQSSIGVQTAGSLVRSVVSVDVNLPLGPQFNFKTATAAMITKLTDLFVEKVIATGNSRENELKADEGMLDLVSKIGYDPNACIELLERIPNNSGVFKNHPSTKDRIANMKRHLKENQDSLGFSQKGLRPAWTLESAMAEK